MARKKQKQGEQKFKVLSIQEITNEKLNKIIKKTGVYKKDLVELLVSNLDGSIDEIGRLQLKKIKTEIATKE